jgi:hypothetical protein
LHPDLKAALELSQKTQIATLQLADVVNAVAHHSQARESQAERESTPFFRVDVAGPQNVGMN